MWFNNYVDNICEYYNIKDYTINKDKTVDVDNNVYLENKGLKSLPFKFGRVTGWFNISNNQLTSLEGSPNYIRSGFNVGRNKLESLKYSPAYIGRFFDIQRNDISSFEFFPNHCAEFICYETPLEPIWNLFKEVDKIELFNDYDIIRDNTIILDRLSQFLQEIKKPFFPGYKTI